MSKDKASFLVQITNLEDINGKWIDINVFHVVQFTKEEGIKITNSTLKWWIIRWRLLQQYFVKKLQFYVSYIYIYIYTKIIKTIFDFNHIDEYIDKNQLNEIRVLYRFL